MGGEVVGHNDLPRLEGGGELLFHIGLETGAVHGAVQHPGRDQAVVTESGDEGLRIPMTEGGMVDQSLADRCPTGGLDEIGLEGGLVDKN